MRTWPVEEMNVDDLLEAMDPANERERELDEKSEKGLGFSVERFGLAAIPTFNRRNGRLVGGHQRLRILSKQGVEKCPVIVVDLDPTDHDALRIALNNPATQGRFADDVRETLRRLEQTEPELSDRALLWEIPSLLGKAKKKKSAGSDDDDQPQGDHEFELSPAPYEHYSYVVLLFRNAMDWTNAVDMLGLERVEDPYRLGSAQKVVGLGRVIDGAKVMSRIRELEAEVAKLRKGEVGDDDETA